STEAAVTQPQAVSAEATEPSATPVGSLFLKAVLSEIERVTAPDQRGRLATQVGEFLKALGLPASSLQTYEAQIAAGVPLAQAVDTTFNALPSNLIASLNINL